MHNPFAEFLVVFPRPTREGDLKALGRPVHRGRTFALMEGR